MDPGEGGEEIKPGWGASESERRRGAEGRVGPRLQGPGEQRRGERWVGATGQGAAACQAGQSLVADGGERE